MPVRVAIEINGREVEQIRITNVGPVEGRPGVWRYHVARYAPADARTSRREVEVVHRRADGVAALVAIATTAVTS